MKTILYDNNNDSFDRFTLVIEMINLKFFYGMSENALHPQGFNQYLGSNEDGFEEGNHLGTIITMADAPLDVQTASYDHVNAVKES